MDAGEPVNHGAVRAAHAGDPGWTRVAASLTPAVVPELWTAPRFPGLFVLAVAAVITVAAGFAVVAMQGSGRLGRLAAVIERTASARPDRQITVSAPQLVVGQAVPSSASEALRLGVSLDGPSDGAVVLVGGLAPGSAFSAGRSIGDDRWRLSAAEIAGAVLTPPRGFAGIMDLTIELRLADDTLADRKSLRLEWTAPGTAQEGPPAGRRFDVDEITSLIKRGEQFAAKGDLAAARLLFQRAAEAGDARAAFAVAETYDPAALRRWGEQGLAPDLAMARAWYERARKLGSTEASQRLQMLASHEK